jgi:hypothetical protein
LKGITLTHHLSKHNQEFHLNASQAFGAHSRHLKNNSMLLITVYNIGNPIFNCNANRHKKTKISSGEGRYLGWQRQLNSTVI